MERRSRRLGLAAIAVAAGACTSLDGLSGGGAPSEGDGGAVVSEGGADLDASSAGDRAASACDGGDDPDLVAFYTFDEASGATAVDCSSKGNHGAIVGAVTRVAGKHGSVHRLVARRPD